MALLWIAPIVFTLAFANSVRKLPGTLEPENALFCPIQQRVQSKEVECDKGNCEFAGSGRILRRVGIRSKTKGNSQRVPFRWTAAEKTWGVYEGTLSVPADGELHCISLEDSGIPLNIPAKSFQLLSPGTWELIFSERASEAAMRTCPMPVLGKRVDEAFGKVMSAPKDEKQATQLAHLLKQTFAKYDCRRDFDSRPVPAWYLCGHAGAACAAGDPARWFQWLSRSPHKEARRVFASPLFRNTLDGELAEVYRRASENMEKQIGSLE